MIQRHCCDSTVCKTVKSRIMKNITPSRKQERKKYNFFPLHLNVGMTHLEFPRSSGGLCVLFSPGTFLHNSQIFSKEGGRFISIFFFHPFSLLHLIYPAAVHFIPAHKVPVNNITVLQTGCSCIGLVA